MYRKYIFKKKYAFFGWRVELDQDSKPDPLISGTDPRIRIRTTISRICNTALHDLQLSRESGEKKTKCG